MKPPHLDLPFFRWTRFVLGLGVAFTLLLAFFYLVKSRDFSSAGSALIAVSATYMAFAALLFSRASALPQGPSKVRSIYAAERIMQAIAFAFAGAIMGLVFFSCGSYFENAANIDSSKPHPWLLIFFVPLVFILWGYGAFLSALKVVSREFFHPLSTRDIARRIRAKR